MSKPHPLAFTANKPLVFVDTETTGLSREDRVISLGMIRVENPDILRTSGTLDFAATHLIFNPGRPSDPRARKVHGYADEELACQQPFSDLASEIAGWLQDDARIYAHNASFDERFVRTEFDLCKLPITHNRFSCTMREYRQKHEGSAALAKIAGRIGIGRSSARHSALEDAWLALQIYCWLHDLPIPAASSDQLTAAPVNYRNEGPVTPLSPPPKTARQDPVADLHARGLPIATCMMAVANADGDVLDAEVQALSAFIEELSEEMERALTLAETADLLAAFADLRPTDTDIAAACRSIIADPYSRQSLAGWIREMTFADGEGSRAENAIIGKITDNIRNAR